PCAKARGRLPHWPRYCSEARLRRTRRVWRGGAPADSSARGGRGGVSPPAEPTGGRETLPLPETIAAPLARRGERETSTRSAQRAEDARSSGGTGDGNGSGGESCLARGRRSN